MKKIRENLDLLIKIENGILKTYEKMVREDYLKEKIVQNTKENLKELISFEQSFLKEIIKNKEDALAALQILNIDNHCDLINFDSLKDPDYKMSIKKSSESGFEPILLKEGSYDDASISDVLTEIISSNLEKFHGEDYMSVEINIPKRGNPIEDNVWRFPDNRITEVMYKVYSGEYFDDRKINANLDDILSNSSRNLILKRIALSLLLEYFYLEKDHEKHDGLIPLKVDFDNHIYYFNDLYTIYQKSLEAEAWIDDQFFYNLANVFQKNEIERGEYHLIYIKYLSCFANPYLEKQMMENDFYFFHQTKKKENKKYPDTQSNKLFQSLKISQSYELCNYIIDDLFEFYNDDELMRDFNIYDINIRLIYFSAGYSNLEKKQKDLLREKINQLPNGPIKRIFNINMDIEQKKEHSSKNNIYIKTRQ